MNEPLPTPEPAAIAARPEASARHASARGLKAEEPRLTGFVRFLKYCFLALGILILGVWSNELYQQWSGQSPDLKLHYFLRQKLSHANASFSRRPAVLEYTVWIFIGAMMTTFGILYTGQRFSLGRLLGLTILIGFVGALPGALLGTGNYHVRVEANLGQPIRPESMGTIRERLEPARALATLPQNLRAELAASYARYEDFSVELVQEDPWLFVCHLRLPPGMPADTRKTLAEFYGAYFSLLAANDNVAAGHFIAPPGRLYFGGAWDQWEDEWAKLNFLKR